MIRARAGISYTLSEAMDEGHCGLPIAQLVPMAVRLLTVQQLAMLTPQPYVYCSNRQPVKIC